MTETKRGKRVVASEPSTHSLDEWAEIVRSDLVRAVDAIMEAGRHLRQAKREHPGTFKRWIDSGAVGIKLRQVERLMAIANKLDGLKVDTACRLPKDTLVVYQLAVHLTRAQLEAAIESGEVHPKLNRDGVRVLLGRLHKQEPPVELLELVQQRWTPRVGYSPRPKGSTGWKMPAPPRGPSALDRYFKFLIEAGDLNLTVLHSDDVAARLVEKRRMAEALAADIAKDEASADADSAEHGATITPIWKRA